MPSIVSSENFQYCETYGTINYRQFLIKKKLNENRSSTGSSEEEQKTSPNDDIFF